MTPAARFASAIDLLDQIFGGASATPTLARWTRNNRFAGSSDRAAIRDIVYDILRRRRSLCWLGGTESGRGAVLGYCHALSLDPGDVFTGGQFAPAILSAEETAAIRPDLRDAPSAVCGDYPDFLQAELERSLGEDLDAVLAAMQERAPVDLRVNTLKAQPGEVMAALAGEEIETAPLLQCETALRLTTPTRKIAQSRAYLDGLVELQDVASQQVAALAGAAPAMTVLDYCAGGGGKTLALAAAMAGAGRLIAHDANPARMADLPARAARAGADIEICDQAGLAMLVAGCDLVLCDVPCSGSGAWRRDPAVKWTLDVAALGALNTLQDEILREAVRYTRPGGRLIYTTCSILRCENSERIKRFTEQSSGWKLASERQLSPLDGGDGFYFAALELQPLA